VFGLFPGHSSLTGDVESHGGLLLLRDTLLLSSLGLMTAGVFGVWHWLWVALVVTWVNFGQKGGSKSLAILGGLPSYAPNPQLTYALNCQDDYNDHLAYMGFLLHSFFVLLYI
jgi:hypothetical protein